MRNSDVIRGDSGNFFVRNSLCASVVLRIGDSHEMRQVHPAWDIQTFQTYFVWGQKRIRGRKERKSRQS